MGIIERLRDDHQRLRAKVSTLESSVGQARRPWELRYVVLAVAKLLYEHIRREERLAASGYRALGRIGTEELSRFAVEHDSEIEMLHVLKRCVAKESNDSLEGLRPLLLDFIETLRRRTAEQELLLFPMLERVVERPARQVRRVFAGTAWNGHARHVGKPVAV